MDRAEKIDCGANGELIFTGVTAKFQLKKGLTPIASFNALAPRVKQGIFSLGNSDRISFEILSDISRASSIVHPLILSVRTELVAIAAPEPKALNVACEILFGP